MKKVEKDSKIKAGSKIKADSKSKTDNKTSESASYERGLEHVKKVYGSLAKNSSTVPAEIRDDVLTWALKAVFGDIWTRPTLDLKTRLFITIAVLAATNRREGLHEHVNVALKNGISREEVCEVLFHIAFLVGLPATSESLRQAQVVFDEVDAKAAAA